MTRAEALRRIRACLRLSASPEPHEAAAALRQAQALMREHGISAAEAAVADVQTATRPAGRSERPAAWLALLFKMVGEVMGATPVYSPTRTARGWTARVRFVGVGPRAEIAAYAYTVCARQLAAGRAKVLRRTRRLKRATRIRRADLWCHAWVTGVRRHVQALALPSRERDLVALWMQGRDLSTSTGRRAEPRYPGDIVAIADGIAAGDRVRLHHGVEGRRGPQALPGR